VTGETTTTATGRSGNPVFATIVEVEELGVAEVAFDDHLFKVVLQLSQCEAVFPRLFGSVERLRRADNQAALKGIHVPQRENVLYRSLSILAGNHRDDDAEPVRSARLIQL